MSAVCWTELAFLSLFIVCIGSYVPQCSPKSSLVGTIWFLPFVGQVDQYYAGTIPEPRSADSLLPLVLPVLLSSACSGFVSFFHFIKALLHSSLASVLFFPLVALLNAIRERCCSVMEVGEGIRRSFSIHRGMEFWGTMEGQLLRVQSLGAEEDIPWLLCFQDTIKLCFHVSLTTKAQKVGRP